MQKEVERLHEEMEAVVTAASQQDEAEEAALGSRRGDERPPELTRREERIAQREAAMRRWERQAKREADAERHRRAAADAERQRTGKKHRGTAPKPVDETPTDKAQTNVTDPELHIRQTPHKGWAYCGKAQASVDGACQIILAGDVTDAPNDKQQAVLVAHAPLATLAQAALERPQAETGAVPAIPATLDRGDDSAAAAQALEELGCAPSRAMERQRHHAPQPEALGAPATAKERLAAKVRTPEGQALYARRKVIVEPVFGQIKEVRGFRRFLLRGLQKIRGDWRLIGLTHNLLKLWRYGSTPSAASGRRALPGDVQCLSGGWRAEEKPPFEEPI